MKLFQQACWIAGIAQTHKKPHTVVAEKVKAANILKLHYSLGLFIATTGPMHCNGKAKKSYFTDLPAVHIYLKGPV